MAAALVTTAVLDARPAFGSWATAKLGLPTTGLERSADCILAAFSLTSYRLCVGYLSDYDRQCSMQANPLSNHKKRIAAVLQVGSQCQSRHVAVLKAQ